MLILSALVLLGIGMQCLSLGAVTAPEIDPASGASAIALIAGLAVIVRGRRKP
jgi:hypothetical protein